MHALQPKSATTIKMTRYYNPANTQSSAMLDALLGPVEEHQHQLRDAQQRSATTP
jgi:hypothetical protein